MYSDFEHVYEETTTECESTERLSDSSYSDLSEAEWFDKIREAMAVYGPAQPPASFWDSGASDTDDSGEEGDDEEGDDYVEIVSPLEKFKNLVLRVIQRMKEDSVRIWHYDGSFFM